MLQQYIKNNDPVLSDRIPHKLKDPYYISLIRKIVSVVIIVSMTPMIIIATVILRQFKGSYHEKVHAHMEELVQNHRQNIDTFLKEKLRNIRVLMESASYYELSDEVILKKQLQLLQKEYGFVFVDLGVVNQQGVQVSYSGPFMLTQANYKDAKWFQEAIKTKYYISDVFTGLRGHPHFIVSVRNRIHNEEWILRATIDFGTFNTLVRNISIGDTGFAFILNKKGEFQTQPDAGFALTNDDTKKIFEDLGGSNEKIVISESMGDANGRYIYASASLKQDDWVLVCRQDLDDAYLIYNRSKIIAVWIILAGSIAIFSMAILLSNRIVRRIADTDREKEMMNQQVIETGKLASVGELAAGIAHEINNPVAIMVEEAGWIQDLLEEEEFQKGKNLDEFQRALRQIQSQGRRCKEITHKLLSFARKTDTQVQDIQINGVVEEIIELSRQMAKHNNIIIEEHLQDNLPLVHMSPSELQQILLNLINNAIDAMLPIGGKIIVRTELRKEEKDYIMIAVEDTGAGIPQANLSRIFDPFFTTKPVGKGTGLGLSICYGIIHKIGGFIDVESSLGMGTVFRIRIPVCDSETQ